MCSLICYPSNSLYSKEGYCEEHINYNHSYKENKNAGSVENNHFAKVGKMVKGGVADVLIKDINLSRYACYLIVQNDDPEKEAIAFVQTYFLKY